MGWWLTAADELPVGPASDGSSQSIITALIVTLGTVLVALISVGLPLLLRRDRTSPAPPEPDPRLGEKVAVLADRDQQNTRTLDQLDRHVDGIGDQVDRLRWEHDDLRARVDELYRRQGLR